MLIRRNEHSLTSPQLCQGDEEAAVPGLENVQNGNRVEAYAAYMHWVLNYTSTVANDWNIAGFLNTTHNENEMMRQWMYQSCAEFGYFQTAPQENALRSARIDLVYHLDVCERLFGAPMSPAVEETNQVRGYVRST